MQREWDLDQVSDGRLYSENDLVKVGCNDCEGCSSCCHGMGESIILDPYDIFSLTTNLDVTFEQLLDHQIELHVVDGVILPNLKLSAGQEGCTFLNEKGRCSIHEFRPGICRLFPLGRYYQNEDYEYFLQVHECPKPNKTKLKINKWLGIPNIKSYHQYIRDWHYYLKSLEKKINNCKDDEMVKKMNLYLLNSFFLIPYEKERKFYEQFNERLEDARKLCYTMKTEVSNEM